MWIVILNIFERKFSGTQHFPALFLFPTFIRAEKQWTDWTWNLWKTKSFNLILLEKLNFMEHTSSVARISTFGREEGKRMGKTRERINKTENIYARDEK